MDHPTDIIPLEVPESAPDVNELIRLLDQMCEEEIDGLWSLMEDSLGPCSGHARGRLDVPTE